MKKLLTLTSLLTFFVASSAFAKSEGSYFGVDLLSSSASHKYVNSQISSAQFKDSSPGFGISYKHAFNFDKVFFAPGVFFDKLGTKAVDSDGDNVAIDSRYGIKFDLGYDFDEKAAIYLTGGIATVNYSVNWDGIYRKKSGAETSNFFGAGLAYHLRKDLTMNLEYNVQSLNLTAPTSYSGITTNVKSNVAVAKIGVAYHF